MDRRSQNSEVGVQSSAHALVSALGLRTASPEREQEVDANGSEGAVAGLIEGKGYFIWRVEQVLARPGMGTPREAARQARDAGIEHVIVKVADGDDAYPLQSRDADGHKEEATVELIAALRREGIRVWGWAVAYGEGPEPERQAAVFAGRARQLSLTGLVVNAENHGERIWFRQRGEEQARRYMRKLREELAEVEGLIIGFSSYRYIEYQPSFPFAAFMEEADIAMPRIFWVSRGEGDAIADLRRSYREYKEAFPRKLYIPVGAAYGGSYGSYFWSASPRQIHRLMDQARAMGLPAVSFWSWEHALYDLNNRRYNGSELWDAIAAYDFTDPGADDDEGAGKWEAVQLRVDGQGYRDGLYPQFPYATFIPMVRNGQPMKYARTVASTPSSVWALWRPEIENSGHFDISVWIPGQHATTRSAHYHIHGVVGEKQPIMVEVNQSRFSDTWVSLGTFELDGKHPQSGQVNLTNHTDEDGRHVAFAAVRWQKVERPDVAQTRLADGFDSPVGTAEERRTVKLWPGQWVDANPFGNYYRLRNNYFYHTGADLNLNSPRWDSDRGKPVFAVASGVVTFAGFKRHWGKIVVIRHDPMEPGDKVVYSRCAHLARLMVEDGQRVQRGQQIGTVGQDAHGGAFHLHFDISPTEVLYNNPGDWPGLDRRRLYRDYVDPRDYILERRPRK